METEACPRLPRGYLECLPSKLCQLAPRGGDCFEAADPAPQRGHSGYRSGTHSTYISAIRTTGYVARYAGPREKRTCHRRPGTLQSVHPFRSRAGSASAVACVPSPCKTWTWKSLCQPPKYPTSRVHTAGALVCGRLPFVKQPSHFGCGTGRVACWLDCCTVSGCGNNGRR